MPMTVAAMAGRVNPGTATTWTPMPTILNSERNFRFEDFNIHIGVFLKKHFDDRLFKFCILTRANYYSF